MRHTLPAGLIVLLLAGCGAGWHRTEPLPDATIPPRDQFLVHHGDSTERWHALQVTGDSVAGIPWLQPIDCDSCRVTLSRTSVDSIRAGHPVAGLWKGYALVVYGPILLLSSLCILTGNSPSCWVIPST